MNSPIKAALSWFTRKFQEIVGDLPKDIQTEINNDVAPQQAVNNSFKKQGIFGKLRQRVTEVIEKAAGIGLGQKPKPMPELHTAAGAKQSHHAPAPALAHPCASWDASKMRLSEKLHGTDAKMRAAIIDTIREQLKLGKHAKDAALALYDGYNSGKHVVRQQQLPVYMQKIVNLARRGELTDEEKKHLQRLIRRAEAQTAKMGAKGAPNKALKTAYNELLNAVNKGAGKALERGIKTAVEEKSRYVAERIARTEAARAWAEAFHARYKDDDEVLAYKWQLGSRHPNFDVCDMYAEANLYGLGKGIFPKDKCPTLPAHPHCLCHLTPVYKGETDLNGQRDNVKQGGDAWLAGLTHAERCKVLGIDGAKAWESGAGDWRENMRGYSPETLGTRLTEAAGRGKIIGKGGVDTMIHSELAIVKDNGLKNDYRVNYELVNSKAYHDKFVGLTEHKALDEALYKRAAKMLEHRSGSEYEDIAMLNARTGKVIVENDTASGTFTHKCGLTKRQIQKLNDSGVYFEILHNHPNSSMPSPDDIKGLFIRDKAIGSTIVCHDGAIYRIVKLKSLKDIEEIVNRTSTHIRMLYPGFSSNAIEYHTTEKVLEYLKRKKYVDFKEL